LAIAHRFYTVLLEILLLVCESGLISVKPKIHTTETKILIVGLAPRFTFGLDELEDEENEVLVVNYPEVRTALKSKKGNFPISARLRLGRWMRCRALFWRHYHPSGTTAPV
jgi:hypothetical protein